MTPPPDSIDDLTRDPAAAELMRRALRERAEEYAGTALGEKFADVLAGRLDVRSLGDDPAFAELTDRTRVAFEDYWAGLDSDQRSAAVRAGNARLAEVAEELDS